MYVEALSEVSDSIVMLHFVRPEAPEWSVDADSLDEAQSRYWGVKVSVKLVAERKGKVRWWEYLLVPLSLLYRPRYRPFVGREQVAAIKASMREGVDIVFAHRLSAMLPFFRIKQLGPPIFFDLDDVEHRVKIRSSLGFNSIGAKVFNLLQVPAIYFAEKMAASIAAMTFVCSDIDQAYLRRLGISKVLAIPNALPVPVIAENSKTDESILFLGTYEYPPNADAAERLITRIWPEIAKRNPQARLMIVGKRPDLIPSFALKPLGVEFTGVVPDLMPLYLRSRLVCCPIMIGGGTRVKLVEAAGYAKPIISTAIGAEGLALVDGEEILIRDSDDDIADACVDLLNDEEYCSRLGAAARRKAELLYDVSNVRKRIAECFAEVLERDRGATHI